MPDKNPPAFPPGDFFCAENRMWTGTPVKANTLDRAGDGQTSAPDFCIFALSPALQSGDFLRRTHVGRPPAKGKHPGSAGGCSPHFSDFRIVLRSRRPGGFLWAMCARQPDLDSGSHFHRDGLSPGRSPSGRGGAFCRISFSPAGFLYRKRAGPKACPFLNRWEKID